MARVASRMRLRRSRCASDPSSDSARTATSSPDAVASQTPRTGWCVLATTCGRQLLHLALSVETIRMPIPNFSPPRPDDTDVSCCNDGRLDGRTLALLEHVLVGSMPFSHEGIGVPKCRRRQRPSPTSSLPRVNWSVAGPRGPAPSTAAREIEQGDPDAWRAPYAGLAQLGIFGVAMPEESGGAGGAVDDLCAMVDEAAAALVPGPVATTALATLVIPGSHADAAGGAGLRRAHRGRRAGRRPDLRRRPGIGHRRVRAGRRSRRGAAAAGRRRLCFWSTPPPTA